MTAIHTLQAFDQALCVFRISGPIEAQTLLSLAGTIGPSVQPNAHVGFYPRSSAF